MGSTDRNAPCPCGSGLKFKSCCGGRRGAAADPVDREARNLVRAIDALSEFAEREEFRDEWELAHAQFWGEWEETLTPGQMDELLDDPTTGASFYLGFTIDTTIREGRSILDMFLERRGGGLAPGVRRALERLRSTHVGVYRVEEHDRNGDMVLSGVLEPGRFQVESALVDEDGEGALLVARLYPLHGELYTFAGNPYDFDPESESELLELIDHDRRAIESVAGPLGTVPLLKHMALRFHAMWLETTGYGEPVDPEPHAWFDILACARLVRALDGRDELAAEEDDVWVLALGDEPDAPAVEISIEQGFLLVAGDSDDDVEEGCAFVERVAGDAVERVDEDDDDGTPLDPEDFGIEEGP